VDDLRSFREIFVFTTRHLNQGEIKGSVCSTQSLRVSDLVPDLLVFPWAHEVEATVLAVELDHAESGQLAKARDEVLLTHVEARVGHSVEGGGDLTGKIRFLEVFQEHFGFVRVWGVEHHVECEENFEKVDLLSLQVVEEDFARVVVGGVDSI